MSEERRAAMAAYGAELISVPPVRLSGPRLTPAPDPCIDSGAATHTRSLPVFFAVYDALPLRQTRHCLPPKSSGVAGQDKQLALHPSGKAVMAVCKYPSTAGKSYHDNQ